MLTPEALATLVASVNEAELAIASGVSRKTLNRIKAQKTRPSYERVLRIAAEAKRLKSKKPRAKAPPQAAQAQG